ncbi:IclR family transcriptional regulator (plasmid) [Natrinema zhouii]|uniref:IclR family transcriptional regulator n=1 Tax=Natrinema zhouii TaxID=1710539 RepID=UPI001CFFAD27|nr:IclR family transcriptional regulator [Natrinema zhouii]UHQ98258.1 IclR family transcriptional regulator [Natrinema zhouii]
MNSEAWWQEESHDTYESSEKRTEYGTPLPRETVCRNMLVVFMRRDEKWTMGSKRILSTTASSLKILEIIIKLDGATLSEISDEIEMARSAVHTHLNTLKEYGYVVKDGQFYRIGLKLTHFGEYAKSQREAHSLAEKWVSQLAEQTELETDFAVEENGRIVSLYDSTKYSTESTSFTDNGRYFYCHNTAAGKAILSNYSDDRVNEILDKWGMPADTPRSITSRERLFDELQEVSKQGYATSIEESINSLNSVSCAVQSPREQVCGAFVVSGPSYALDENRIGNIIRPLKEISRKYENDLEQYYNTG